MPALAGTLRCWRQPQNLWSAIAEHTRSMQVKFFMLQSPHASLRSYVVVGTVHTAYIELLGGMRGSAKQPRSGAAESNSKGAMEMEDDRSRSSEHAGPSGRPPARANGHASAPGGHAAAAGQQQGLPMLASACPGWVCYAEKTHGEYVLPHISATKSPQVLACIADCRSTAANHRLACAAGLVMWRKAHHPPRACMQCASDRQLAA